MNSTQNSTPDSTLSESYVWSRPVMQIDQEEATRWGAPRAEAHATARVTLDESWYQARGVFGGLSAALMLEVMSALEPDRAPRSMTVQCVAPALAGPALAVAARERRGGRVTHLSARLYCGDELSDLCAFAGASFGSPRGSAELLSSLPLELSAPEAPLPKDLSELYHPTLMPKFAQHFIYFPCIGGGIFSGDSSPTIGGWCDLRAPGPVTYPLIAALFDAWAPAVFASLTRPLIAASVDFSYHFMVTPEELSALERPFFYRGEVTLGAEGYLEERDVLWDRRGKLVATARQLIAVG